jgi:hypothetical protein
MTHRTLQSLKDELGRQIAFNKTPLRYPKGREEITLFRIYINIVRQAEEDYLSRTTSPKNRAKAAQTLFGIHLSPLPTLCRILGLNYIDARLKIIEWKLRGMKGDPVFEFLQDKDVARDYEMGKIKDLSSL